MRRRRPAAARVPAPPGDRHGMSTEEIARTLGVSRQAVSQTVQKALAKLQRELRRRGIRASDLF